MGPAPAPNGEEGSEVFMTQLSESALSHLLEEARQGKPPTPPPPEVAQREEIRQWCRATWASLEIRLEKFIDRALADGVSEAKLIAFLTALEMMREYVERVEEVVNEREGGGS